MTTLFHEKITTRHRERHAYVYVRQSTPHQVQHHLESQRNQYALVQRAIDLGWPAPRVHVIDADLGQSGQDSQRPGFQELVTAVSLGRVGLIVAYEASRLARNNTDWYTLLDIATVVGTLIADTEGVYDPCQYNDRLLLGLRGLLSEAELHVLRLRMEAGRQRQIARGTYQQTLPTGLVRLETGHVIKDPDRQIQHTLELVFARFVALGSCHKVMRSLRDDGILLPRRQLSGLHAGQVRWCQPTPATLGEILHNPAYAGAFVYGRRALEVPQRPGKRRRVQRPMEDWQAIHHAAYPAYISWEQFLTNQARLADNASSFARRARGVPRQGQALLAGLVVCGRCGYQMRVVYKPRLRYTCQAMADTYGASSCVHVDGASVDDAVTEAFFAALAPAELQLLDEVVAAQRADHARLARHYADQAARAQYEAALARRQYEAVDPDHRLVAAELEHHWELALQAVEDTREAAERFARQSLPDLPSQMQAQLRDLGRTLPDLWRKGHLKPEQKKELLRSLIRRVVIRRPFADTVEAKVVWVSGAVSTLAVHPPLLRQSDRPNYEHFVERLLALGAAGYSEREIAQRLTQEGFRSARSARIPVGLVGEIRGGKSHSRNNSGPKRNWRNNGQYLAWPRNWECIAIGSTHVSAMVPCRPRVTLWPATT
jgi:DNA invertase Pin-like site-specific DNA recombinase